MKSKTIWTAGTFVSVAACFLFLFSTNDSKVSNQGDLSPPPTSHVEPPTSHVEPPTTLDSAEQPSQQDHGTLASTEQAPPSCIVERIIETEDGPIRAIECVTNEPKERHPYESYSTEVLESLAYGDAKAAEVLGVRLIQQSSDSGPGRHKGVEWIVRAAALSGDGALLNRAAANAYSIVELRGEIQTDNIKRDYVLREVAKKLTGKENAWKDRWESLEISDEERQEAEQKIQETLKQMAEVQYSVTGSTDIEELLGNG